MVARGEANEVSATPGERTERIRSPGGATETFTREGFRRPSGALALCCGRWVQGLRSQRPGVALAFGSLHPWLPSGAAPRLKTGCVMSSVLFLSLLAPAA